MSDLLQVQREHEEGRCRERTYLTNVLGHVDCVCDDAGGRVSSYIAMMMRCLVQVKVEWNKCEV